MNHSESAGGVIINPKGQVLVVSQHGTSWSLPKGHIDEGENHKMAASREIQEETGITKLKYIKKLGTYRRSTIGKNGGEDLLNHKTITMFLYTTPEQKLQPIDPDNPEARWVDPDKVSELLTHAKDKAFYSSAQSEVARLINNRSKM